MTRSRDDHEPRREPELPEDLARDLGRIYGAGPRADEATDARALERARPRLRALRERRRNVIRWVGTAAAAALVVSAVLLVQNAWRAGRGGPGADWAAADLDRSGRVDILDAFLLARRLDRGGDVEASWDLTGDGVVDRVDVDHIAREAVRGGGS